MVLGTGRSSPRAISRSKWRCEIDARSQTSEGLKALRSVSSLRMICVTGADTTKTFRCCVASSMTVLARAHAAAVSISNLVPPERTHASRGGAALLFHIHRRAATGVLSVFILVGRTNARPACPCVVNPLVSRPDRPKSVSLAPGKPTPGKDNFQLLIHHINNCQLVPGLKRGLKSREGQSFRYSIFIARWHIWHV